MDNKYHYYSYSDTGTPFSNVLCYPSIDLEKEKLKKENEHLKRIILKGPAYLKNISLVKNYARDLEVDIKDLIEE